MRRQVGGAVGARAGQLGSGQKCLKVRSKLRPKLIVSRPFPPESLRPPRGALSALTRIVGGDDDGEVAVGVGGRADGSLQSLLSRACVFV